jgi:hypothetical protein
MLLPTFCTPVGVGVSVFVTVAVGTRTLKAIQAEFSKPKPGLAYILQSFTATIA